MQTITAKVSHDRLIQGNFVARGSGYVTLSDATVNGIPLWTDVLAMVPETSISKIEDHG